MLWDDSHVEIHGIDIYASETVDIVCDGHYLPLADKFYDGVWIQAVLEHVVEPQKVVDEIFRVLKLDGIVYAETPFMQQVHEGAYDFTRFTVVGHRFLFKAFEAIDFGGNRGPEIVLAWSLRYFFWGITRSRKIARFIGVFAFLILRPFGRLMSKESMFDGPSGVFFFGKKTTGINLKHMELPLLYRGSMR
jgi:SAM-dependent methyltransferase